MANANEIEIGQEAEPERGPILLVEDEVLHRWLFAEELRNAGFQVIEAATADEAWAYLASGGKVDLIFTDVVMPGSMDGHQLCRRVNNQFPAIKIIVTSGNSSPQADVRYERFLPKPFLFDHAIWLIRKALRTEQE